MAKAREGVSKFGKFLSGMVMPNIGAFIAWGFITALFIEKGWMPNADLAKIVSPMLQYLIPILIAGQGGYAFDGNRGRVIGSIAVFGAIMGTDYTMLMGAMLMGPLAGWVLKKWDEWANTWKPAGLEMLVDNFSLGIIGLLLAILGFYAIGPFMGLILVILQAGVQVLVDNGLMPLLAFFIEPAKVLFLNNAIGNGIFVPIGTEQVKATGQSIMFMLEANPGPGVGMLLAYALFCKDKATKQSAPGAIIIQFIGGIHEIYFPYILMNPKVIIGPMLGNFVAILFSSIFGLGLVAPASPGSIIAFASMAPRNQLVLILLDVAIAAAVSFVVSAPLVRDASMADDSDSDGATATVTKVRGIVSKIVFACDAGMGSSAMGATRFHNRIKLDRPDIVVEHASVDEVPADADVVVVQASLADRARKSAPNADFVVIKNFLQDPGLDSLYQQLVATSAAAGVGTTETTSVAQKAEGHAGERVVAIDKAGIQLGLPSVSREEAIKAAGKALMDHGSVDASYVDAMLERDREQSVYMGLGVAIPHGTNAAKGSIKKTCVVLLQYPQGVQWGDEKAYLVFGIAGANGEHLQVLANVARALEDEEVVQKMRTTTDKDWLLKVLG